MSNFPINAEEFLIGLFAGRVRKGENVVVLGFSGDPKMQRSWQPIAMRNQLPGCIHPDNNGYANISLLSEDSNGNLKAKKANVARTNIIMVDDLTQEQIDDLPIVPTYSVETSPNNYQAGYLLDAPLSDQVIANKLMQEIGKSCGGDPGANNTVRWFRLPYCANTKQSVIDVYGKAFQTRLVIWKPGNKYTPQQIAEVFNIDITPQQKSTASKKVANASAQVLSQFSPGNDHLLQYLEQQKMLSGKISNDGWHVLNECPWYKEHTDQDPLGSGYGPLGSGTDSQGQPYKLRRFHCFHGHCADRDISDFYQYLIDNGYEPIDDDPKYLNASSLIAIAGNIVQLSSNDPGCCFEPFSVEVLARLMVASQADWQRIRLQLKAIKGVHITALQKLIDKAAAAFAVDATQEDVDQLTVARTLIDDVGEDNILYTLSNFYTWNGTGAWKQTDEKVIQQRVHAVIEKSFPDLHISQGLARGIVKIAETECFKEGFKFNQVHNCINCLNGELHWVNNQFVFKPHNKLNYLTSQIPVEYDEHAQAQTFLQFLHGIFDGDPQQKDKARLIIQLMGYSLLPTTQFETFVILIGVGANGKSVLLKVLKALLGRNNVSAVQTSQFDNKFQRAHMNNKLANIVSEIKEGEKIDDNVVKAITSGESSTVEEKFKSPYDMEPFCTLWFGSNHMPRTTDFSNGLFRRAQVIPFNRQFKSDEQDRELADKLIAELPGILNLCLKGLKMLFRDNKFIQVQEVDQAVQQWRKENDQASLFFDDCCIYQPNSYETSAKVYDSFKAWAKRGGIYKPLDQNTLTNRLRQFKVYPKKLCGIRVLAEIKLR